MITVYQEFMGAKFLWIARYLKKFHPKVYKEINNTKMMTMSAKELNEESLSWEEDAEI